MLSKDFLEYLMVMEANKYQIIALVECLKYLVKSSNNFHGKVSKSEFNNYFKKFIN